MIRNLFITLGLSFTLLLLGAFVFMPTGEAQSAGILPQLLELPAAPPANPLVRSNPADRPAEFFNQENPPADDAPIEDLLVYWESQNGLNSVLNHTIEPSPRVLERLLDEVEKNPSIIGSYLNIFSDKPESADVVKRIYDRISSREGESNKYRDETNIYLAENLKQWLTSNTDYFSDELLERARQIKDTQEYVANQDDLLALARVDFEKARPLLERLVNDSSQPASQTVARWAFYLNALKKGSSIEAGNYRDELMKTVEDRAAKPGIRDLAFDAIVYGGDFPGLDDWYLKLMEDETLHDLKVGGATYTGLTTLLLRAPPDKYVDKMIELLKSSNPAVRNAAVRNLTTVLKDNDERVVRALLPWLENPNWAKETGSERMTLVQALAQFEIPESVPGLIAALNEKATVETDEEDYSSNSNMQIYSNTNSGRARGGRMREIFPLREAAVDALIRQKNPQAATALRGVLPEVAPWKRGDVIKAILFSGGFTIPEQVEALEIAAREQKARQDQAALEYGAPIDIVAGNRVYVGNYSTNVAYGSSSRETFNPADIKKMLGDQLTSISEPSSELVAAVSFRITSLERSEPPIAEIIRTFMQNWQGAAVNALLLDYLAEGKSDLNAVVRLLSARKDLRENQIGSIYDARSRGNTLALGIAACLLENNADYAGILADAADDTKIAMLGCARLIRARLSLEAVAPYLKSPNKLLALAAERYIESEDSPAARQIIYALYPNEAKILGATYFFGEAGKTNVRADFLAALYGSVNNIKDLPPYYFYMLLEPQQKDFSEEKLRREVREDETLLGIYGYDKNYVRIYRDRAVFSWEEDEARYFERKLSDEEFGYLKSYLSSNDVNNLPPFVSSCGGCQPKELVMVGRQGGRRVFVFSNPQPQFFEGLEKIFEDMRKPPAALRYWLEKDIAGARILFADDDLQAVTVWKSGDDLRVLVNNTARQMEIEKELEKSARLDEGNDDIDYQKAQELFNKRRMQRAFESFSWHSFAQDKLGDFVNQPVGIDFISPNNNFSMEFESEGWSAKSGNVEVKTDGADLFKVVGGQTTKIQTGYYRNPVISANGRWVVLTKYIEEQQLVQIMRINLQTNREFAVKIDNKRKFFKPVADISAANKILIETGNEFDYENGEVRQAAYYLLDPDTGAIQAAKGEFRPFMQETFRKLQKAANPNDVWAAVFDKSKNETQIGTFNEKTFVFTPVLNVPQISFDSMEMWVDEASNKVFIVYRGQLLSIPLRKESNEPKTVK